MHNLNIMEYAFPVMLVLIVTEILFSWLMKRPYYRANAVIADVSTGIIFAMVGVANLALALLAYAWIETNFSLKTLGIQLFTAANPFYLTESAPGFGIRAWPLLSWIVAILAVDLVYYWFHRLAHEIALFWASHVTHHSTEEIYLTVAFRGNATQRFFEYPFFFILALLGLPWVMFLLAHRLLKIYQFAVHTRFFGKLGILEEFMVTPSLHRLHHDTVPEHLDVNHGGIFIIWDRLFGTYAIEKTEPLYGLTHPVRSFNPLWTTFHEYVNIFRNASQARTWKDRLWTVFGPPGWKAEHLRTPADEIVIPAYTSKYDPQIPVALKAYAIVQATLVVLMGLITWKVALLPHVPVVLTGLLFTYVVFGLTSVNGVLERKRWSIPTEFLRSAFVVITVLVVQYGHMLPTQPGMAAISVFLVTVSLLSMLLFITRLGDYRARLADA
ncbi:MAG: sterol desaturase family protein [Leptospiraceae bacterium]|nr:sterol desaturase family protein [Leptospiraceae bacterium]